MSSKYIYWRCKSCNHHRMSDKTNRWSMDWCRCGKSGVDAEEYYSRYLGNVEIITEKQYEEGIRNPTE